MTADQIRDIALEDFDTEKANFYVLREIAAQLAELNERLKPLEIRDRTFEYPEGRP